jgi:acetyl esterase/lipase
LCDEPLKLEVKEDKVLIDTQIQLYATNAQLCHPFVSPILGYLGGLPPLYIMAGDKEVLRDEIIYMWVPQLYGRPVQADSSAHKAANPEKHPIRDDVRAQLPSLDGIEQRFGPTNVHLQVYDGEATPTELWG